jgi:hypothetical protein
VVLSALRSEVTAAQAGRKVGVSEETFSDGKRSFLEPPIQAVLGINRPDGDAHRIRIASTGHSSADRHASGEAGPTGAWTQPTTEKFAPNRDGLTPAFARATTNAATWIDSAGNTGTS